MKVSPLLHQEENHDDAPGVVVLFHLLSITIFLVWTQNSFSCNNIFTAYGIPLYIEIPTIIIVYCYLSIFKTVRTHNNNIQFSRNPVSAANVEEIKVTRTLFVMVVFFNLCWIPILLIDIVDSIQTRWTFSREVYVAYTFLAHISSALNPLIYGVLNRNFRTDYLKLLCCRYCRSQVVVEPLAMDGRVNVIKTRQALHQQKNASN